MKSLKEYVLETSVISGQIPVFNPKASAIYCDGKRYVGKFLDYKIYEVCLSYDEAVTAIYEDDDIDKAYFYFLRWNDIYDAWEVLDANVFWQKPNNLPDGIINNYNSYKDKILLKSTDKLKKTAEEVKATLDKQENILIKVK